MDGFASAEWWTEDAESDDTRVRWSVQYRVRDRAALDAYLEHHAARLRGDGLTRFAGQFEASRRVLDLREAVG